MNPRVISAQLNSRDLSRLDNMISEQGSYFTTGIQLKSRVFEQKFQKFGYPVERITLGLISERIYSAGMRNSLAVFITYCIDYFSLQPKIP